ncbi:MAG: HAD family phosphatase [Candidatus Limnocylindrales bacterium]|jgi:HAD superfamily hydrolase (TIGR01509 family)
MRLAACYPGEIGGVVFDMDGVLTDTEPIHARAMKALLARFHAVLTARDYAQLVGLGHEEYWRSVRKRFCLSDPAPVLAAQFERILLPSIEEATPTPSARFLLNDLGNAGVPLALASSSPRRIVDATLLALGFQTAFNVSVAGDEIQVGKPGPEIYVVAAARLGVETGRCVAIEDSVPGMVSARAAGMRVIGLASRYVNGTPSADLIIRSLLDLADDRPWHLRTSEVE